MYQRGQYWGVLKEWGCNKAETGTPFVFLVFEITHYNSGNDWEVEQPADRTVRLFTSRGAWPYTKEKMQNLGFNGDDFPQWMYDQGLRLNCEHEEYEGKTREKWDIAGGGGANPDNDSELCTKFKRHWKAEFGSQPAGTNQNEPTTKGQSEPQDQAQQQSAAVTDPESIGDDDIPF